jgi:adenylate cyclase
MALAMREQVRQLTAKWRKMGYKLDFGVGIAQGYATIGGIGFEGRWDYGAIGTVTNLASRLGGDARPSQILVSQRLLGTYSRNSSNSPGRHENVIVYRF